MTMTSWRQWLGFAALAAILGVGAVAVLVFVLLGGCAC
jgi:hypothetical protein